MIGVHADEPRYLVAIAELPVTCRAAAEDGAAVVVTRGLGPALHGASVAVLVDPGAVEDLDDPGGCPVIVDRARLRADVAADAGAHPGAVLLSAHCVTTAAEMRDVVRDAVGWLRTLGGEVLGLDGAHATPQGIVALLRSGERAATLAVTVLADGDAAARPRLRALAVGADRVEVLVDGLGAAAVSVSTEAGTALLPARREARERLALRRAIDALPGHPAPDLRDLRHDDRIAAAILSSYQSSLSPA